MLQPLVYRVRFLEAIDRASRDTGFGKSDNNVIKLKLLMYHWGDTRLGSVHSGFAGMTGYPPSRYIELAFRILLVMYHDGWGGSS